MRTAAVTFASATALTVALVSSGAQAKAPASPAPDGLYIVQTVEKPAVANDGSSGKKATKPAPGQKFDSKTAAAKEYDDHLKAKHNEVLDKAGVDKGKKKYDYTTTVNGFAAKLTGAEVERLRRTPGVRKISANRTYKANTVSTRDFLGLTGSGGAWEKQFGGDKRAGEGVIVGVIDTGIWPDNPSFAPLPEPRPDQGVIEGKWKGECVNGAEKDPKRQVKCNNKLIGARYFNAAAPWAAKDEFKSPRDFGGHGTHTAATAAGNFGVDATINGSSVGKVSGVAPAARIAAYKALWETEDGNGSGSTFDLVAAVNAAVADGVDVINYSISGNDYTTDDPIQVAFLNAAAAGIFVSASAGNQGDQGRPDAAHGQPWVTTVAASTHDRGSNAKVVLGNGKSYTGAGNGAAVPNADLVDSTTVGKAGKDATEVKLCYADVLDPAKVKGKVVACARGVIGRTEKSAAVSAAGGVGMVLYNTNPNTTSADYHVIPSVHVDDKAGAEIVAYAKATGAKAALTKGEAYKAQAPQMAGFSSYGPTPATRDLLKPDITAPGVDIVAAVAKTKPNGNQDFQSMQGTSMSAPHIAGVAALLKSKNPSWSPAAIKSAMMTSATQTDNHGKPIQLNGAAATPLNYGAGHVRPGSAFDPGLVYDSGAENWVAYMCALGDLNAEACSGIAKVDPSDLNYPSIAVGDLGGSQVVTRTVTNTTGKVGIYRANVQAPAGTTVTVSPSSMVIMPGKSVTFRVNIRHTSAPLGKYTFGSLTWTDNAGHAVRSPIAVKPVAVSTASEVVAAGKSGSTALSVKPGFTGTLTAGAAGLVPAKVDQLTLTNPNGAEFDGTENDHTKKLDLKVGADNQLLRLSTFDSDLTPGTNVDLYLVQKDPATGERSIVSSSAKDSSEENITLLAPKAGDYEVWVDLWGLPTGATSANIKLHTWQVPLKAQNLTITPTSQQVREGTPAVVTARWSGLQAGTRYLALVVYGQGEQLANGTVLRVDG